MKNNKLVIHTPDKIDQEIEDFKLDSFEDGKNYSAAKIKLTRDVETEKPIIWYSQELIRNHRDPNDPFGKRQILKPFTSSNLEAVSDETLTQKFQDTVNAYKKEIPDYAPLTDVHSMEMKVFVDEDSAQFIEDIGVSVDGLNSDFSEMESVEANPFYEDAAGSASRLKKELWYVKKQLENVKESIADEFDEYKDPKSFTHDEFAARMALEKVTESLVQRYLSLQEQKKDIESRLGEVNREVYRETTQKIRLPDKLKENIYDIF
jgi:hypothetical protein|tara:strand:+ start:1624 stop:2412 length:789 start_codon:yes stop_codon:yes gene_type:complete